VVGRWCVGRGGGVGRLRGVISWLRWVVGRFRGVICWLRCMVGRLRSVVGWTWRVISLLLRVVGCSFIGDLSNISLLMVSSVVHVLCPTIRQGHRVGSNHRAILVRGLSSLEGSLGVVIIYSIVVGVGFRGFFVVRFWFVVGRSMHLRSVVGGLGRGIGWSRGMVGGLSRNVGRGWGMVGGLGSRGVVGRFRSRGVVGRFGRGGVVGWSMDYRGMMNNRCLIRGRFVVYWWFWGMVWLRSFIGCRSMVWLWSFIRCRCMVGFGRMVGCWGVVGSRSVVGFRGVVGDNSRGVNTYNRFLYTTIAMDRLGGGSRLAGYMGVVSIVGLVDRHVD